MCANTLAPDSSTRPVLPRLPWFYFAFAHGCLALAALALVVRPASFTGFYYHPKMIAVVHLVTLGWITGSILGALYLVGPMAFRTHFEVRRLDTVVFVLFVFGATGIPSHFWIEELSGVAWSGLFVLLTLARVGWRVVFAPRPNKVPAVHRLGIGLAFGNILLAATLGTLLGLNKLWPVLPGRQLANVHGHAHLAALGWGLMMVLAVGYRLFPMVLPAAMPKGWTVWASLLLLEGGALGLLVAFFFGGRGLGIAALLAVAGVLLFLDRVRWMLQHRKRPAQGLPKPEPGVVQVLLALGCLLATSMLGLFLAWTPTTETSLRLCLVYGLLGLLGFLGQMVAAIASRLTPLYTWLRAFGLNGHREPPALTPHALGDPRRQWVVVLGWQVALLSLALGFLTESPAAVRVGGAALLAAVVAGASFHLRVGRALSTPLAPSPEGTDGSTDQTSR